ncbi:MAG: methionyl-tRNA formyltransferase [Acidobacteriota bacterium]
MPAIKKLVFFGTPEFAVPTLDALEAAGRTPNLVVSQPDRPAGRGQEVGRPPVAEWAVERKIPLLQPESVKDPEFIAEIEKLAPDVAVVVAFGQIFPPELLAIPKQGCINLHASLLPKHRGASPVQGALLNGDKKTGVTTMLMDEEMDTGPILLQDDTLIRSYETTERLQERLAKLGGELMVETLNQREKNKIKPRKQRDESSSYSPQITKRDGKINWALTADEIYNRLRAYTPWPGLAGHFRGRPLKIVWGVPMTWEEAPFGVSGTFLGLRQGRLAILCGQGTIFGVEEVQRPGKKAIRSSDFANGERVRVGETFA